MKKVLLALLTVGLMLTGCTGEVDTGDKENRTTVKVEESCFDVVFIDKEEDKAVIQEHDYESSRKRFALSADDIETIGKIVENEAKSANVVIFARGGNIDTDDEGQLIESIDIDSVYFDTEVTQDGKILTPNGQELPKFYYNEAPVKLTAGDTVRVRYSVGDGQYAICSFKGDAYVGQVALRQCYQEAYSTLFDIEMLEMGEITIVDKNHKKIKTYKIARNSDTNDLNLPMIKKEHSNEKYLILLYGFDDYGNIVVKDTGLNESRMSW